MSDNSAMDQFTINVERTANGAKMMLRRINTDARAAITLPLVDLRPLG